MRIQLLALPSTVRNGEVTEQPFVVVLDRISTTPTDAQRATIKEQTGAVGVLAFTEPTEVVDQ